MPGKKLGLFAAAFVLANQIGLPADAAVPPDSLAEIRSMIRAGQLEVLREYLVSNRELMNSDSPLSRALAEFFDDTPGLFERLGLTDKDGTRLTELADIAFTPGIY